MVFLSNNIIEMQIHFTQIVNCEFKMHLLLVPLYLTFYCLIIALLHLYNLYFSFYKPFFIPFPLSPGLFSLLSSCDRCVSSQTFPSLVWPCSLVGQLGRDCPGQWCFHLGRSRVQSRCSHDVAHLLFCKSPVLVPAAGANQGRYTKHHCVDRKVLFVVMIPH